MAIRTWFSAVAVSICAHLAWADFAYQADSDGKGTTSFGNAANWRVNGTPVGETGAPLPVGYDYMTQRTLRTPTTSSTFAGQSLTIGEEGGRMGTLAICGGTSGCEYVFPLLNLRKGVLGNWLGTSVSIKGTIVVQASASAPFGFYDNGKNSRVTYDCVFAGAKDACAWLYAWENPENTSGWGVKKFEPYFKGTTLANYQGTICCHQFSYDYRDSVGGSDLYSALISDTVTSPASVVLHPFCQIGGESADSVFEVASIDFKRKSGVKVTYDKTTKTASCVAVSDSFTHEGKIRIIFDPQVPYREYYEKDIVPELTVFKAPTGVTLDVDDFVLDCPVLVPVYDLYVGTEGERSVLKLKQHGPVVWQDTGDGTSDKTTHSFTYGDHWRDGLPPDGTKVSYSESAMRALGANPVIFPGYALVKNGNQIFLYNEQNVISNLHVTGNGMTRIWDNSGKACGLYGKVRTLALNAEATLDLISRQKSVFTIGSDLSGDMTLRLRHGDGDASTLRLEGDNAGYSGRIVVFSDTVGTTEETGLKVACTQSSSLGGEMPTWTYDGVRLGDGMTLEAENSLELAAANRGIFLDGAAYAMAAEGVELSVTERLTWKGSLTKRGDGTLALGGAAPFFETDGGTTPIPGNNALTIADGALKPLSADAFRKLAVTMEAGTAIRLGVPSDATSDLAMYGMRLTEEGSSLALPADGVVVSIDLPETKRVKSQFVPICTVPASAAPALRGKFTLTTTHLGDDLSVSLAEKPGVEAETVTFGVELKRGFVLLLR